MSTDYRVEKTSAIHAAIESQNPFVPEGSFLNGWALVAEFIEPNGKPTLVSVSSEELPSWTRDGYFHAALDGQFNEEEEDED